MADDDLDLSALPDDDLVGQMHDDLYDGLKDEIEIGVRILLDRGWTPYRVLTEALVEGMRIVGVDFRDGILFVPEVLLSANAMKAGMAILKPLLAETGAPKTGKMVIGTVKGDIHDIGRHRCELEGLLPLKPAEAAQELDPGGHGHAAVEFEALQGCAQVGGCRVIDGWAGHERRRVATGDGRQGVLCPEIRGTEVGQFEGVTAAIGAEQGEPRSGSRGAVELVGVERRQTARGRVEERPAAWRVAPQQEGVGPKSPAGVLVVDETVDHAVGRIAVLATTSRLADFVGGIGLRIRESAAVVATVSRQGRSLENVVFGKRLALGDHGPGRRSQFKISRRHRGGHECGQQGRRKETVVPRRGRNPLDFIPETSHVSHPLGTRGNDSNE